MTASTATPNSAVAKTGEREIVASRVFDAPRELVWKLWTEPEHIAQWWGPNGFTNTIHTMDVRPGGVWDFIMHGPDGTDYKNVIIYREVERPKRLVYEHGPGPIFDVVVDFDAEGDKTRITLSMIFETVEQRDKTIKAVGAVDGLNQTLGHLEEQLAKLSRSAVVITRDFDSPRAVVFDAWIDPKHVQNWWGPRGFTNPRCEWDATPGGNVRVDMRGPDGTVYPMTGEFHEVAAPERIVFTTRAFDGLLEVLNTITFADNGGRTKLTLRAVVTKSSPEIAGALAGMREGWTQSFDKLADEAGLVIKRVFDAPRELVFKAWTEPERLAQWWGPKGFKMKKVSVDLRPGGVFHYGMTSPDGHEMWGRFVYREITPPERLVFVNSFSDENAGITRAPFLDNTWPLEVLNVLTFTEQDGKTLMTMRGGPINANDAERKAFDGFHPSMQAGFAGTFAQLDDYLAKVRS
jgi:uncharacterized protein YndB with AHSA1/START domain